MKSYRFGRAWRALGVTAVVLAVAFPFLMVWNNEPLEVPIALALLGLAAVGVWCYAYFARYLVTISADGFAVHRLGHRPFEVAWRNVISVRSRDSEVRFGIADGRSIAISVHYPGHDALTDAAARHLPDGVFESPGHRSAAVDEPVDPQTRRMQQLASQRVWLRTARRSVLLAAGLAMVAFVAGQAQTHLNFQAVPRSVAVILFYVSRFVEVGGYTMSAVQAVFAVVFGIMYAQEVSRSQRVPPAA